MCDFQMIKADNVIILDAKDLGKVMDTMKACRGKTIAQKKTKCHLPFVFFPFLYIVAIFGISISPVNL